MRCAKQVEKQKKIVYGETRDFYNITAVLINCWKQFCFLRQKLPFLNGLAPCFTSVWHHGRISVRGAKPANAVCLSHEENLPKVDIIWLWGAPHKMVWHNGQKYVRGALHKRWHYHALCQTILIIWYWFYIERGELKSNVAPSRALSDFLKVLAAPK